MLERLSFLSDFTANIPFESGAVGVSCTLNSTAVKAMGYATDKSARIWVYDSESIITYTYREPDIKNRSGIKITVPLANGTYAYKVYDTAAGSIKGSGTVKSVNGAATVTLPEWSKSVAVEIG